MIRLDDAHWVTYDVEGGAVITAVFVIEQDVQWMCYSERFGELDGYFN